MQQILRPSRLAMLVALAAVPAWAQAAYPAYPAYQAGTAYKAGDMTRAREWFEQIVEDAEAPRNVANRAQMLLDNIKASGKAP